MCELLHYSALLFLKSLQLEISNLKEAFIKPLQETVAMQVIIGVLMLLGLFRFFFFFSL
jgi:hypothetical protein